MVAEQVDGERGYDETAARVSEAIARGVSGDNVRVLVEEKLRPLGVLARADGTSPELRRVDPLLALKFRTAVVPDRLVRALTTVFYPLFFPPVVVAVLAALAAVDVWFFFVHGVAQPARAVLYNPALLLMVLGLTAAATAFHEIGHATAARYGGARPGAMGVGLYVVWPAFYTDVTDAYRLGRGGRLRTDLGGVYFNGIFVLGIAGAYFVTGYEPLLILIVVQHLQVLQQFLPFLRLDGYYVLSDLTGVPDMFTRIRPTLASLLPWRKTDPRVEELKPWVRFVTTGWVLTLVPVLLFTFGSLVISFPRVAATGWDSLLVQTDRVQGAVGEGDVLTGTVGSIQALFLLLPLAGMTLTFGRVGKRVAAGAWSWSADAPLRRGAVALVLAGAAGIAGFVWLPNGDYKPIQPGERGTVQGAVDAFSEIPTGRPGLSDERERERGPEDGPAPGQPAIDEEDEEERQQTEPTQTTQTTQTETGEPDSQPAETTDRTETTEEPPATTPTTTTEQPDTNTTDTTTTTTTPGE